MLTLYPIPYSHHTPTTGRSREREAVRDLITASEPWVCVVEGADGSGKTTFVKQCMADMGNTMRILHGECTPSDQNIAYGAFRDVLSQLLGTHSLRSYYDDTFSDTVYCATTMSALEAGARIEESRGVAVDSIPLTELLPLVSHIIPVFLEKGKRDQAMGDCRVVRENIHRLLSRLIAASDGPVVLILENLHWLDHASLALLKELSKNVKDIDIIVTTRPLRTDAFITDDFFCRDRVKLLRLGRLDIGDIVCSHLSLSSIPPPVSEFLAVRSRGNPLLAIQLAWLMAAEEMLMKDGQTNAAVMPPQTTSQLSMLPDTIEHTTESRVKLFAKSDPHGLVMLKVCSVIGPHVHQSILYYVYMCDGLSDQVEGLVNSVVNAGYLEKTDYGYKFCHIVYQECAYRMLPPQHRRLIHHRIAEYLENPTLIARPSGTLPLLALHWLKAGVLLKAVNAMEDAALSALNRGAAKESSLYLGTLSLVARHDENNRENRHRQALWQRVLGDSLLLTDDVEGAANRYESCLSLLGVAPPGGALTSVAAGQGRIGAVFTWLTSIGRGRDEGKKVPDAWTYSEGDGGEEWGMGGGLGLSGEDAGPNWSEKEIAGAQSWNLDELCDGDVEDAPPLLLPHVTEPVKTVIDMGIHQYTVEDEIDQSVQSIDYTTLSEFEYYVAPRYQPKTQLLASQTLCAARACIGLSVVHSAKGRAAAAAEAARVGLKLVERVAQSAAVNGMDIVVESERSGDEPVLLLAAYAANVACGGVTVRGRPLASRCAGRVMKSTAKHCTHPRRNAALICVGAHLASNAQWDTALQSLYEARHHAAYIGDAARQDEAVLHIGVVRILQGDVSALLSSLDSVVGVSDPVPCVLDDYSGLGLPARAKGTTLCSTVLWARVLRAQGLVAWPSHESVKAAVRILNNVEISESRPLVAAYNAILGLAHMELGDLDKAVTSAGRAWSVIQSCVPHYWLVSVCSNVMEVYCRLYEETLNSREEDSVSDVTKLKPIITSISKMLNSLADLFVIGEPTALLWSGVLRGFDGDSRSIAEAQHLYSKSLHQAQSLGLIREEAMAQFELGRLTPETDHTRGVHLEAARDLFGTRGASLSVQRIGSVVYWREI